MSTASQDCLLDAVEGIYSAAVAGSGWRGALSRIVDATGSSNSVLLYFSANAAHSSVIGSDAISEDRCNLYQTELGQRDNLHPILANSSPGELIDSCKALGEIGLRKSNIYGEWYQPLEISYFTGALLGRWRNGWVGLSVNRTKRQGPHSASDLEVLKRLIAHLRISLRVSEALVEAESKSALSMEALSQIRHAAIIFGEQGNIVAMNTRAEPLLDRDGPFQIDGGRLTPRTEGARRLCDAVREMPKKRGTSSQSFRLNCTHQGNKENAAALLFRPGESSGSHEGPGGCIMIVRKTGWDDAELQQNLRRTYGLTVSEARVAAMCLVHSGTDSIADRLSVGRETVRTHLKHIYLKLGVSGYPELIQTLAFLQRESC